MASGGGEQCLSDHYFDVNCTICAKKNRVKEAQQYCTDCRKNLCHDCVEIHVEHNEGHTLVDGHGDDEEVNLLTEKCEKHKDKLIELFCEDHDELVCSICALLEHRNCEELKHITDSIAYLNKDQKVHGVPGQLKTALQNVNQVITLLEQHIEELPQRENKLLEEIEEYTRKLLAKIESLQRNARKEISIKHEKAASEATNKKTLCVTAKTDILKCLDDIASVGNRDAHLFILKKKGEFITNDVETLCRDSENMMEGARFFIKPDMRIGDTLNKFTSLLTDEEKYKTSSNDTISASVKGDSTACQIIGCCRLPNGTVLLTDYNNSKVKHMDPTDCTMKDHCRIKGGLRGITCIGPHEVAVCTGGTNLQVTSLSNTMTSTIQLKHKCYRIAQSNGELFASCGNCVHVHDLTGTLLRTICKNASGENMFSSYIRGIVLDQTGDRVYITDRNNGLICTDRTGQVLFRLSQEDLGLSEAYGVCTDQRGNVLVSGYWSHNVVQVTEDGRVIGEILSKADGIEYPQCLCYDAGRRRLYVVGNTSKLLMHHLA